MVRAKSFLAGLVLLTACTTNEIVTPEASTAGLTGSVVGRITTKATGLPLAGVTVSVLLPTGTATTTTGLNGEYVLADLPAATTHRVRFFRTGYAPVVKEAILGGASGSVTQDNPMATIDLVMTAADASLEGTVFAGGLPAAGATVTLDLRGSGYDLVGTAVTDATGGYRIDGLPANSGSSNFSGFVQPWDADADGTADYLPASAWVALYPGMVTRLDVTLTPSASSPVAASLRLLTDDVVGGVHAADTALRLTFDRPIDAAGSFVDVDDSTDYRAVAVEWEADAAGTALLIAPVGGAPFANGHEYRVDATIRAADGTSVSYYKYFTADAGGVPPSPATGLTIQPAAANYNTGTFTLRWNAVAGADRYEVWIRDTFANPSFTRLTTVGSQPSPAATLNLPSAFDYYTGDGLQTPLTWGTAVEVAVVPVGVAGASGGVAAATPLQIVDTVAPSALSSEQDGTADASASTAQPLTVTVVLAFDEYMDPSSTPVITLPGSGLSASFAMDPGLRVGTLTVTVPPGVDGSGNVTVSGLQDTSGNAMTAWTGRLFRRTRLTTNGDFESGSLTGWTSYVTGTASAPAWVATPVAAGAGAARLGNSGTIPQNGYSRLHQDVVVPAGAASVGMSVSYRGSSTNSYGYDDIDCGLYTTGGSLLVSLVDTYVTTSAAFVTATRSGITGLAGTPVRLQCQVYQWSSYASRAWIDDLTLYADQ